MSYSRVKTFNAGKSRTGLNTVAYSLDGGSTWTTSGVSESPADSGIYQASITFADDFNGTLSWTTGDASPRYGSEDIASSVVATLPSPAPTGYGPIGTGSITVNQDYPTTGNLTFKTSGGQGIGGAIVLAYLASEFTSSPNTATVRGQTITLDSGAWANVIDLDPGDYTLVFKAEGYETTLVNLTVS